MGLFSFSYNKPGPGVSPDTPRKRGVARLLEVLGRDMGPFFKAGFLAVLGALPYIVGVALSVMTHSLLVLMVAAILGGMIAAPQIVGMADTVLRSLRDEPGFWWHTYRRTWKINARASLIPGALFGLIFGGEIFLYTHLASMQAGTGIITMLLLAVLLSLGVSNYIWAQIALLNLPFFTILKNGMFLFLAYLPVSLGATVVLAVYWGAVVLLFPISFPVLLLTNFWLPMVPSLLIVYTALDKSFEIEKTLKEQQAESAESNS